MERLVRSRYSKTLKEISMPGSLQVNIYDVSLFIEMDDLIKQRKSQSKQDRPLAKGKRIMIFCDGLWYSHSLLNRDILVQTNVEKLYHGIAGLAAVKQGNY